LYDNNDKPLSAAATECNGPVLAATATTLKKDIGVPNGVRSGRSSYIGYTTNARRAVKNSDGKRIYAYCHDEAVHTLAASDHGGTYDNVVGYGIGDMIGEVSVTNEDGNNYIYGLPVYS